MTKCLNCKKDYEELMLISKKGDGFCTIECFAKFKARLKYKKHKIGDLK